MSFVTSLQFDFATHMGLIRAVESGVRAQVKKIKNPHPTPNKDAPAKNVYTKFGRLLSVAAGL